MVSPEKSGRISRLYRKKSQLCWSSLLMFVGFWVEIVDADMNICAEITRLDYFLWLLCSENNYLNFRHYE